MRIRGAKTELEEAGESTEGMAESTASMRKEIMALSGVDIMLNENTFKSTYQVMDELSDKWEGLSDIAQASIIELMAGKHQGNVFASLMANFDTAREALEVSANSAGSAMEEHAKWSESLEARLLKLKATWQSFAQSFMKSDLLKGGLDVLIAFVDILDTLVSKFGTLGTLGLGAGIFSMFKNRGIWSDVLTSFSSFGSVAKSIITAGQGAEWSFKRVGSAAKAAGADITKSLGGSLSATVGGIGLLVSALGLAYNAYKNKKEQESADRQETIASSTAYLDAASNFEKAYIKYSGRTDLTADEEAELTSAINGAVDALGDKSGAMKSVVENSNDYLSSLEAIRHAELEDSKRLAKDRKDAAEEELTETAKGWSSLDGSEVDVSLGNITSATKELSKEQEIAQKIGEKYYKTIGVTGQGNIVNKGFQLDANASAEEVVEYYNTLIDYKNALEDELTDDELKDSSAYDNVKKSINALTDSVNAYTDGVYEAAKANYQFENGIPKTIEEYLAMRDSIIGSLDGGFDYKNTIAEQMDSEYSQLFDLSSVEAQARKFKGIIKGYGDGTKDGTNEIGTVETFLNMRTAVNNGECTVGQYISEFDKVTSMASEWSEGEKNEFNSTFGLDIDSIKKQYDDVYDYLSSKNISALDKYENTPDFRIEKDNIKDYEIQKFLGGLSAYELQAVVNLQAELDWENDDWNNIESQIQEEAELIKAISFDINIENVTAKLESLSTAMSESVSGSGLSTTSITAIQSMFKDLDSYDPSKLFERTATGIRLNTTELSKLNSEYKKTNVDGLENKMDALGEKYIQTKEELSDLTYGTDEYNKKARNLSDIEAQINATEKLIAQYDGLTNAYQEWQKAEAAGNQRDMYENVLSGFETVKDELSRGWADDGTVEFLELLTGRTDLASKSGKELKEVWDDIDDTIKHTSYSVKDFFTKDKDGNSTSKGVYNFLDAIGQMEEEAFGGKDVVKRNKDGNIIGFDFQIVGGNEAIADALGISEELVDIMVRAADDAGFVVSMDGTYQQLDVIKEKAQEAAKSLKETFKKTEFEFDLSTGDESSISEQYNEALKIWGEFSKNKNADGTIDMEVEGAEEAFTLVSTLQTMVDQLSEPVYMELDASQVEKDMQSPLSKLQEYERLVQQENQLKLKGTDTSEIDKAQTEIIDYFEKLSPEIKAELGIKDLTREELQSKIEAGEIEIPATVDLQVEMNNTMRDMVNVALYNAGLIDGEEFEKRVDVEVYANNVDASDVADKTEEAVENENGEKTVVEKEVEVNVLPQMTNSVVNLGEIIKDYDAEDKEVVIKYISDMSQYESFEEEDKEAVVKFIADTLDVDGYTPEEKEAYARYIADGGNVDDYTPEEKTAIAKYLADTGEPDSYTPEEKTAIAKFIKNSAEVDNYTPEQKQAIAKFIKDSIDVDNYQMPTDKWAYAKYLKETKDIDIWTPPLKTGGVAEYSPSLISTTLPILTGGIARYTATVTAKADGTANVNGTAFAHGTTGRAYKKGDWSVEKSETALTGELGQELVVYGGRYWTVGDNGAEFTHIPKGAIVFNHKQTEELFKNGKITSSGGRGRFYANGSAFAEGTAFSSGTGGGFWEDSYSSSSPKKSSSKSKSNSKSNSNSSSSSNSSSETEKEFEETIDWIETAIDRIERAIDQLDTKANSVYRSWSERNSALSNQISEVGDEIELQQKAYDRYIQEANSVGLDGAYAEKVRNGTIDIETITDEDLANKIKEYQDWYEKALDCQDAILELTEAESELYAQRFEHIQTQYDGILQGFEHTESMLNEYISQAEEKGYIVSKEYYQALIDNEKENMSKLEEQQSALLDKRQEYYNAMSENGMTDEEIRDSEQWITMSNDIDSVTQAIEESTTALLEYDNSMREIDWSVFDLIQERISAVSEEADFLIELMSNEKLFDDNGKLTSHGMATMGLRGQKYNDYMYQADDYGAEVSKLNAQIAKDPYDQELINRRNELLELQRESILAAEDEKNAVRDMVEEGINLELDALQERIDLYNEAMDSAKDLYDYQKKVEEQTSEISDLRKQESAYLGDTSEEGMAKLQEIQVSLKEAESDLEETEYDKYITDQAKLLDSLYVEYESILNTRLDNIDYLLEQMIAEINASALGMNTNITTELGNTATTIKTTLETEAKNVGTTLSTAMSNIWTVGDGNIKSVLSTYGKGFQDKQTSTNVELGKIKADVNAMVDDIDKDAKKKTTENKTTTSAQKNPVSKPATTHNTTPATTPNTTPNTGDGQPKVGDKVKFISGKYYYDSEGTSPAGSQYQGKEVYITKINTASWATHPIHISSGKTLGSGDLGWLKKNQISGYAVGKKNFLNDEVAWTQENGKEFIIRPSDGAILTPIAKGDSVLNASASKNIWDMANSPTDFIRNNLNLGGTNIPNNSNVNNNYNQQIGNVIFKMDGIKNYEEMLSSMQKDKNFEKLILSMSIDRLAGKSSLAKNKSIR